MGIKQYGSQASSLAVDSSDVDLVVTGLKIGGEKDIQLREMRRLFNELISLKPLGYIAQIEIIESATVPLIKLIIDLQKIRLLNRQREERELAQRREDGENELEDLLPLTEVDLSMVHLHIDITFDDYLSSMQLQMQ